LCPVNAQIQSLGQKFPTQENREFSNPLQGRFLDEQGNFQSTLEKSPQAVSALRVKAGITIWPHQVRV